jgi:hypothetical protein
MLGTALALAALTGHAAIINGSFETGDLSGWTVGGTGVAEARAIGSPADGRYLAYLSTFSTDDRDPTVSSLSQTFNGAGAIQFAWNFTTEELPLVDGGYLDYAYVEIDGVRYTLAYNGNVGLAVDANPQYFIVNLNGDGVHTIKFVVTDGPNLDSGEINGRGDSALLIDFVRLVGSTSEVPEPTTFGLVALGLLGMVLRRRKRSYL